MQLRTVTVKFYLKIAKIVVEHEAMSSKRTLVKQKVTYGSVGDGNLHESDDDFSDKRSPTKRVSFGSHELSDSDSDEENSQGRINRSSAGPAGDSLDGLFRESSSKERTGSAEFIKGTSEKQASKDKYSQREDKGMFIIIVDKTIERNRLSKSFVRFFHISRGTFNTEKVISQIMTMRASIDCIAEGKEKKIFIIELSSLVLSHLHVGQPRPAPRPRPTIQARRSHFEGHSVTTSHQSSDEDGEDMSAVTWPIKAKEAKDRHPVPPPRTSPRQHQEKSSSPDMVSPRPVPRSRPTLSPREGKLKLFKQDSDGHQYERTKHLERDSGGRGYEKTEIAPGKPVAPLRRKKTQEETHENRTRPQIPTIRTSTFEDDGPFLDENDISKIEQDGNLRQGQLKKVKGRPVISVARSGSSEESEDDVGEVNRTGFFGNKRNYKEEKSHDREFRDPKEQSEVASEPPKPSPRSRVMTDNSMKRRVQSEEEDNHVMRPGSAPRNRMIDENSMKGHVQSDEEDNHVKRPGSAPRSHMMADNSMKRLVQSDQQDNHVMRPGSAPRSHMIDDNSMKRQSDQQDNHVKRPGSAPSMKKASSLETLQSRQSSSTKKALSGPKEEGAQRVQLKKSLTPQRPISAKKGSFMTKLKAQPDITDTFEEHVPSTENIIETPDERGFRKKGASAFDAGNTEFMESSSFSKYTYNKDVPSCTNMTLMPPLVKKAHIIFDGPPRSSKTCQTS